MKGAILLLCAVLISCNGRKDEGVLTETKDAPKGMVWLRGGDFIMGSDDPRDYDHEHPAHRVRVEGFWIDETEVTNGQYKKFTDATGYKTVAERAPDWNELKKQLPPGTPKPPDSILVAGSLKFTPPEEAVALNDYSKWWKWTPYADWKHPEGKLSNIEARLDHPVVHIAYEDAVAYCKWLDKRLPTEAEWEFASRGNESAVPFDFEKDIAPAGKFVANVYQGSFPSRDTGEDGFKGTSGVRTFPPNGYGLFDMIGNVWEWTSDYYDPAYFNHLAMQGLAINPRGPEQSHDPNEPLVIKYVTKGGSYLCSTDYCSNYRHSARQGTAFDSGQSHIGFRCAK